MAGQPASQLDATSALAAAPPMAAPVSATSGIRQHHDVPLHRELGRIAVEIARRFPLLTVDVGRGPATISLDRALSLCLEMLRSQPEVAQTEIPHSRHRSSLFNRMPPDCIGLALSYLPWTSLPPVMRTCFAFYRAILSNDAIWLSVVTQKFPAHVFSINEHRIDANTIVSRTGAADHESFWHVVAVDRVAEDARWNYVCNVPPDDRRIQMVSTTRGVHSLACDSDTLYIGSGALNEIVAYDIKRGSKLHSAMGAGLFGHQGSVTGLHAVDENRLISCSLDMSIRVWDRHRLTQTAMMQGHTDKVWCVEAYGDRVFSGGSDKSIRIWSIEQGQEVIPMLQDHRTSVSTIRVLPGTSGRQFVSGSAGNTVRVWDCGNNAVTCIQRVRGHLKGVFSLQATPTVLFSGSLDNTIKLWDVRNGFRQICDLFDYGPDGNPIVSGTNEIDNSHGVITFYADDTKVVAGGPDRIIKVFDLRKRRIVARLEGHGHWITALACDGNKIVSGSRDKTVRIWDMNSLQPTTLLEGFHSSL